MWPHGLVSSLLSFLLGFCFAFSYCYDSENEERKWSVSTPSKENKTLRKCAFVQCEARKCIKSNVFAPSWSFVLNWLLLTFLFFKNLSKQQYDKKKTSFVISQRFNLKPGSATLPQNLSKYDKTLIAVR